MLRFDWDQSGIDAELDELLEAAESAVRPAAQAGAQVFYEEVLLRVPVREEPKTVKGKTYQPGTLKASIYQAFSADNSDPKRAAYHISWNAKKAPHGHLIENGHWTKKVGKYGPLRARRVPAQSFIRSSYEAVNQRASEAVWAEFVKRVQEVIK